MPLTSQQISMLKRLEHYLPIQGSAQECHEFYCPMNISALVEHLGGLDGCVDGDGNLHHEDMYDGKPDGFNSACPRFLAIDREKGEWKCLSGLEIIARVLNVKVDELYRELRPHFEDCEVLGYRPEG